MFYATAGALYEWPTMRSKLRSTAAALPLKRYFKATKTVSSSEIHSKASAYGDRNKPGTMKSQCYYFLEPFSIPLSISSLVKPVQLVEQFFDGRLPTCCFAGAIHKPTASLFAILSEGKPGSSAAKIGEKVEDVGDGATPKRGNIELTDLAAFNWLANRFIDGHQMRRVVDHERREILSCHVACGYRFCRIFAPRIFRDFSAYSRPVVEIARTGLAETSGQSPSELIVNMPQFVYYGGGGYRYSRSGGAGDVVSDDDDRPCRITIVAPTQVLADGNTLSLARRAGFG